MSWKKLNAGIQQNPLPLTSLLKSRLLCGPRCQKSWKRQIQTTNTQHRGKMRPSKIDWERTVRQMQWRGPTIPDVIMINVVEKFLCRPCAKIHRPNQIDNETRKRQRPHFKTNVCLKNARRQPEILVFTMSIDKRKKWKRTPSKSSHTRVWQLLDAGQQIQTTDQNWDASIFFFRPGLKEENKRHAWTFQNKKLQFQEMKNAHVSHRQQETLSVRVAAIHVTILKDSGGAARPSPGAKPKASKWSTISSSLFLTGVSVWSVSNMRA